MHPETQSDASRNLGPAVLKCSWSCRSPGLSAASGLLTEVRLRAGAGPLQGVFKPTCRNFDMFLRSDLQLLFFFSIGSNINIYDFALATIIMEMSFHDMLESWKPRIEKG
jgi:hypothetical protein